MTIASNRRGDLQRLAENLEKEYTLGMSQESIGHKYGFSTGTVSRHMKMQHIAVRARSEALIRHGHHCIGKRTPTYLSWDTMTQRCLNPNNPNYRNYGGRGIIICDRWRNFANFLSDMGERPFNMTLERIDTNGNYEPTNCTWRTRKEQLNNKRTNVIVEYQGKRMNLRQWADYLGIEYMSLWHKYRRAKTWPPKEFVS